MKYIKKEQYRQLLQYSNNLEELQQFTNHQIIQKNNEIYINTLEGIVNIPNNDWLVKGVNGEFYPISHNLCINEYDHICALIYRRRSITIEGFQFGYDPLPDWANILISKGYLQINHTNTKGTLLHRNNIHHFTKGSYILINTEQNPYICQEDEFNKSFTKEQ